MGFIIAPQVTILVVVLTIAERRLLLLLARCSRIAIVGSHDRIHGMSEPMDVVSGFRTTDPSGVSGAGGDLAV